MLDRRLVREEPEKIRQALAKRGHEFDLDTLIASEAQRRELLKAVESLRAEKNELSEQTADTMRAGGDAAALKERSTEIGAELAELEQELGQVGDRFEQMMHELPNIPLDEVPVGESEQDNVVMYEVGEPPKFDFTPRPHWEIGEQLGILDFEAAARMAGARFVTDVGAGATLERALINFMLDTHTRKHGYTEVSPPYLANERSLFGTANLPKFEDDLFKTTDGYYLIPTAEVPLTNMHQGEILEGDELPIYYTAYTACFRREAGAAGKETRGMIRVHQFHKVGSEELEKLVKNAETIIQALELPYRRVHLCTGDMGHQPQQTFDLEGYFPGMDRWLELSSVVVQPVRRLSGPALQYPLSSPATGQTRVRAHYERFGPGLRAHYGGDPGELSAGKRNCGDPRGIAPLHGRDGRDSASYALAHQSVTPAGSVALCQSALTFPSRADCAGTCLLTPTAGRDRFPVQQCTTASRRLVIRTRGRSPPSGYPPHR